MIHMSSETKKLGLGVLGLGEGRSIISAAVASPLWEVAKLCDISETAGRQRCHEFGVDFSKFTTSMDAMLADRSVDVVGIYTPDHLHAEHVIRALNAGKHVICTKPFMDNLTQGRAILEAQKRTGRHVMVGQSTRFFAPFNRQREHFKSGELGDLITIEANYNADHRGFLNKPWSKLASFKWLFGGISHPADLVRWYLPDISEVMGYGHLSSNGKANGLVNPDTFHFILKSASGKIASISGAYSGPTVPAQRDSGMTCVLRCTEGASQADYHELRYSWKIGEKSSIEGFEGKEPYYFRFEGISHHAGEYQNYIEYFARCLASGETPRPDATEGIVTVALLQAMELSATREQPVKIADVLRENDLAELIPTLASK